MRSIHLASVLLTLALLQANTRHCRAKVVHGATRKPKELANGLNCTNHRQFIDRCSSLATYSFTSPINPYPQNIQEMKASCDRISEGLKCLRIHTKCLGSFARRSVTAYTNARSKHSKRLCASMQDPKTIEFWHSGECIRSRAKRDLMAASEKELISTIQTLATDNTLKWEETFHQACCSASVYKGKVIKDIEPECTKFKTSIEDMINSMVGELLDSTCPEQTRLTEICAKLPKLTLPKDWKPVSLTSAAVELILKLSDNKTN